ncbi:MAG TPA: efflux RND transporter periplasmic adaptor subunit, partial [Maribacter sp.]|uniref:efflux RND transporter periplasmic adaptor subunit n=1 Tax=unclassified Maribacter TaxID=2615042 RepID=UPI000EC509EF|nr:MULTISPECIES: efflux RND transporter periplasmic adaptor subunit [unclassified Maribacter]HAF79299.1 efflux RND transporter periplasmic adaptor subunit [Maribacter sp.]|tara:strand:+ start:741 stop:1907 length:1167 start_codon:yes stop_codon:yes gene_type:complete
MKKLPILLIAVISLYSCGGEDQSVAEIISGKNLEAIRAKKNEITTQQKLIDAQLKSLDSAIAILGNEEKLPLVNTLTAKKEIFNHYLELQGDVSTKQNVLIYPEMAGTLQRVYVKEGDRVSKGQVLATIDDGGMSSQLNQLKTQASLAKTTFERQERLWNQNIGSEIQYLQAKTNYEAAENMVSQAQSQLGKSTIRAPFSGIIDNVIKDQGTVVAPGQGSEVFRIVNLSDMYIEVEVPEAYLGNVTKGKEALVYFPILGDSVVTKIRETGNFINPSNRSFEAEIPVPNKEGKIKPNLSAKVNINDYTSEDAILIPTSIISENAEGEQYVFVADEPNADGESIVKRTIITTGKTQGAAIEVLTGLNDGDHIIKEGARSVKDGQKVKIKK